MIPPTHDERETHGDGPTYDLTITRSERNPFYKEPPKRDPYTAYHSQPDDPREPHEREYNITRTLSVTLTQGEYDAIKRALIAHWEAK